MTEERYDDQYKDDYKDDYKCCCKCHCCKRGPEPGRAILKCGCGCGGPIPIISDNVLGTVAPIQLASVTIDTSEMKNPTTLLTFTGEITSVAALGLRLKFVVKRTSKCGTTQICGTYTYSDLIDFVGTTSYAFQACDDNECDECVTYTVEYTPLERIISIGGAINNVTLTALAVENICH